MGLKTTWECRYGHTNDPEDDNFSCWRCREADCRALRWPWLLYALGGVAALILLAVIFLSRWDVKTPGQKYQERYHQYLVGGEGDPYTITSEEQKRLDNLAPKYKILADQRKELEDAVKRQELQKLKKENQPPTDEKTKLIQRLEEEWKLPPLPSPESKYQAEYRRCLEEEADRGYDLTPKQQELLDRLAKENNIPGDQRKALEKAVKEEIIRQLELKNQPPDPKKTAEIEQLKIKWGFAEKEIKPPVPPPPGPTPADPGAQVKDLLKQGQFTEAQEEMGKLPLEAGPEGQRLRSEFNVPLEVDVKFQYQHPQRKPSERLPLSSSRLAGLRLTARDNYRLFITSPSAYNLYVYQVDDQGKVDRLFPNPFYNRADNPITPNLSLQIPFTHEEWLYLEEITGPKEGIKNTIYILASPWPIDYLDRLYGKLHGQTDRAERNRVFIEFLEALKKWQSAKIPSLFFQEFPFQHVSQKGSSKARK